MDDATERFMAAADVKADSVVTTVGSMPWKRLLGRIGRPLVGPVHGPDGSVIGEVRMDVDGRVVIETREPFRPAVVSGEPVSLRVCECSSCGPDQPTVVNYGDPDS